MNNKWIVPIVAILLCAVSLIGAGYAAFSATLTDTETTTVDNDYLKLTLGANTADAEVDLEYDQDIFYSEGAFSSVTYTLLNSSDHMFTLDLDVASSATASPDNGDAYASSSSTYHVSISAVKLLKYSDSSEMTINGIIAIELYDGSTKLTNASTTAGTFTFNSLSYTKDYTMKFVYTQGSTLDTFEYDTDGTTTYATGVTTADAAFTQFAKDVPGKVSFTIVADADITTSS